MTIVAIGGGNNSRIRKNGEPQVYEHENIDKEIISLTNKSNPNFLFISHASNEELEEASFNKMVNTYGNLYNCSVKLLDIKTLQDLNKVSELLRWADIIYVGGGDTKKMLTLWRNTGFTELLKREYIAGKVMCGISAGASCWFKSGCSDSLKMELNDPSVPHVEINGLGFVDFTLNPHANNKDRLIDFKQILKSNNKIGLSISDNAAIIIKDGKYKLIKGESSEGKKIFARISYWKDAKYYNYNIRPQGSIKTLIKK